MAKPFCWQLLSGEERAAYVGELRESTYCSRYAWNVRGDLQFDWNHRVQPQINRLISQNYKILFGKSGVQPVLALHLFLLSTVEDPTYAHPTILILTANKKAASRLKKLLAKHEVYKGLNTGFDILYEPKTILMRMTTTAHNEPTAKTEKLATAPSETVLEMSASDIPAPVCRSLCGASVVIPFYAHPNGPRWRRATIFCVIKVEERYFAVLPAHPFYLGDGDTKHIHLSSEANEESASTSMSSNSSGDQENCSDDEEGSSDDSGYHGSDNMIVEDTFSNLDPFAEPDSIGPWEVYFNCPTTLSKRKPGKLDLLGVFSNTPIKASKSTFRSHCDRLDYALIELDMIFADKFQNAIPRSSSGFLRAKKYREVVSGESVFISSQSSGTRIVDLLGMAVTLTPPWSSKPLTVYELKYELLAGESGSVVMDFSGSLLGMAVAASPHSNSTYMVPARDIFTDIYISTGISDSSSDLLDLRKASKSQAIGRSLHKQDIPKTQAKKPYVYFETKKDKRHPDTETEADLFPTMTMLQAPKTPKEVISDKNSKSIDLDQSANRDQHDGKLPSLRKYHDLKIAVKRAVEGEEQANLLAQKLQAEIEIMRAKDIKQTSALQVLNRRVETLEAELKQIQRQIVIDNREPTTYSNYVDPFGPLDPFRPLSTRSWDSKDSTANTTDDQLLQRMLSDITVTRPKLPDNANPLRFRDLTRLDSDHSSVLQNQKPPSKDEVKHGTDKRHDGTDTKGLFGAKLFPAVNESVKSWQDKLKEFCETAGYEPPRYGVLTDRIGGRTAFSASVHIDKTRYQAKYWYDAKFLNTAREDAAEVALQNPMIGPKPIIGMD